MPLASVNSYLYFIVHNSCADSNLVDWLISGKQSKIDKITFDLVEVVAIWPI